MNWNQNAINQIKKCFPNPPTQGPVGRKPIDYLTTLRQHVSYQPQRCDGSSTKPLENLHPCALGQCSRNQIKAICHDPNVDVLEAYAAVMAWGGQRSKGEQKNWFKTSIQHHGALRQLLCQLRASINSRSQDFGSTQKVATDVKGLGISFYTKLLYFFRPTPDAYILDQRTAKSIRVLTGNIIKLTRQGTPDPSTIPQQYEDFCLSIEQLGQLLGGWTGEQVEQALFDRRGGCWRTYVESNIGLPDPDAPEAPEDELEVNDEPDVIASETASVNRDSKGGNEGIDPSDLPTGREKKTNIYLFQGHQQNLAITFRKSCEEKRNIAWLCRKHSVLNVKPELVSLIQRCGGNFQGLPGYVASQDGKTDCMGGTGYAGWMKFPSFADTVAYLNQYFKVKACSCNTTEDQKWVDEI